MTNKAKLTRYEIRFKEDDEGVYYINYRNKNTALKEKKILQNKFPKATWNVRKILLNRWVKE